MKMVVAYIDGNEFEPIREELLGLGFLSISVMEARGSFPEAELTGTYRGTTMESHVRAKARLECIVGDGHARTVVDTVLRLGDRPFAFVVSIDEAHPDVTIKQDAAMPAV